MRGGSFKNKNDAISTLDSAVGGTSTSILPPQYSRQKKTCHQIDKVTILMLQRQSKGRQLRGRICKVFDSVGVGFN